jgi:signal transduction histidine kinase
LPRLDATLKFQHMRLAHQLVLGSSAAIVLVMSIYGVTTLRYREQLLGDALVRETEMLAQSMQIVATSAVRNGQVDRLDRVLGRILRDPDMAISAVLDSAGRVMAGGPRGRLACVETLVSRAGRLPETQMWADCGGRVRLIVLPLQRPAEAIVIARRTAVIERDYAVSRRRIAITSLALAVLGSVAILAVVRLWLTRPLAEILSGVRQLGGPQPPRPIAVPQAAGELQHLARAFNEMVQRLDENQQTLVRETEERIELERRLRDSELFAALGRLTGGVAHELGSPLGVIGVRAEAIQASPGATPDTRRHAEAIGHEVDRIARLIRDLVHVGRRHGAGADRVELGALVRSTAAALRRDAQGAGIDVQADLPAEEIHVLGDATLLHHALYGVGLNAVQALRDHAGERTLRIALHRTGESACVVLEDTGPGIPPDDYARVFEPFFTTKDVGEGTGLGLAISAGIAEEHAGVLTLGPAAEGGVRAQLELPLAPGRDDTGDSPATPVEAP